MLSTILTTKRKKKGKKKERISRGAKAVSTRVFLAFACGCLAGLVEAVLETPELLQLLLDHGALPDTQHSQGRIVSKTRN